MNRHERTNHYFHASKATNRKKNVTLFPKEDNQITIMSERPTLTEEARAHPTPKQDHEKDKQKRERTQPQSRTMRKTNRSIPMSASNPKERE